VEKPLDFFWSENDEDINRRGERKNNRVGGGGGNCENNVVKYNLKKEEVDGNNHHPITIDSSVLKRKASKQKNQPGRQNSSDVEEATIKPECNDEENNNYIQLNSKSFKKVKTEPQH